MDYKDILSDFTTPTLLKQPSKISHPLEEEKMPELDVSRFAKQTVTSTAHGDTETPNGA
jgi:hypothetical protein